MPEGSTGCAREDVVNIRDTLREGHQRVAGIQVGNTSKLEIIFVKPRFTHFCLMAEKMLLNTKEWKVFSGTTFTVQK